MTMVNNCLSFHFITYNVGSSLPEQDLGELLGISKEKPETKLPDFYVTSLQEVKAQPQNMLSDALFEDPWTNAFTEVLQKYDYVKLSTCRLQGLLLSIYCLRKHLLYIKEVESECSRTGILGIWGNKGGVGIRFSVYGCSICVVNAHLAAHDNKLDDRIEDFNEILKEIDFHVSDHPKIFFHDYVFWMGDLNFRLVEEFDKKPQEIEQFIKKGELEELYKHDQLLSVRRSGEAFALLSENRPAFAPTFKFQVGTSQYNYKRRPAWCDRVLFRANPNNAHSSQLQVTQQSYNSHDSFKLSDHKPVTADFTIKTLQVIKPMEYSEMAVQFEKISTWYSREENKIHYLIRKQIPQYKDDWIGIFQANFNSLNEYILYEQCKDAKVAKKSSKTILPTRYKLRFPEFSIRATGLHVLIYFSRSEDNFQTVLGISEAFPLREHS